ncbi:hypothetical protein Kpol_495p21 [Vanderwaltozyma polyspora DSM 70294]|uniref:Zn(2)-C6 fungal-type domain-containing protein n=1 Tax=Vanderwaltozyma polyspora (strain ATCC 22028 / DSM 70294 / BCRC 21397 / CBS 2163 / NBRC 10782 / NRRL Y-8283 / UCD 57-17) TaxID=436907 RepID=A7TNZ8_VANPO|nr:uncharacterized protein Kpol_495p21 [Vanderwaltozyma polyspora DSM 70294]EDO16023.1 hypothetical protein Kpol_495p21 [Vanderwaltozyma polyspora DSM 70294]
MDGYKYPHNPNSQPGNINMNLTPSMQQVLGTGMIPMASPPPNGFDQNPGLVMNSMTPHQPMIPQNYREFYPVMTQDSNVNTMIPNNNDLMMKNIKDNQHVVGSAIKSNVSTTKVQKRRVARACDRCRKRKIKCDEIKNLKVNKCSNCVKYGAECTFKNWEEHDSQNLLAASKNDKNNNLSNFDNDKNKLDNSSNINTPASSTSPADVIPPSKVTNNKIEKLDRKVSLIFDHIAKLEWLLDKIATNQNITSTNNTSSLTSNLNTVAPLFTNTRNKAESSLDSEGTESSSKEKKKKNTYIFNMVGNTTMMANSENLKYYASSLLTTPKLRWVLEKLTEKGELTKEKIDEFICPIKDVISVTLKWNVVQTKKLMDFSSPIYIDGIPNLNSLPPKEQSKRLLENFRATALSSVTGLIGLNDYLDIADKYYDPNYGRHKMSYSELLLLNIGVCSGASITQMMRTSDYHLRKDRYDPNKDELKIIENNALLNAMYYYNKLLMMSEGIRTIQGLLLLSGYLQVNQGIEVALGVLETAIRYSLEMGLNKVSFYEGLSLDELMIYTNLWWRCYSKDKSFSLIMSRPPMIKEDSMDMFNSQTFLSLIKSVLSTRDFDNNQVELDKLKTLKDALNYIINFCEYVPLFISCFITELILVEGKIYEDCFALNSFANTPFDKNLEKILRLHNRLQNWEADLHPCMNLKSYKQCLSTLYVQNLDGNPALFFEIACFRVLKCHFHYFYLKVVLCLFGSSYLIDNEEFFSNSVLDIPSIYRLFADDAKTSCIKMLELFQTFDYQPYVNDEIMYYFLTGVYTLFFYVIKNIDNEENDEIPVIIELLQSTHTHLIGENQESLVSDNMKWNTSIFFYTFLLQQVVTYFNKKKRKDCEVNINVQQYSEMLTKVLDYSKAMKRAAVDQLFELLKKHSFSPNFVNSEECHLELETPELVKDDSSTEQYLPLSTTLFKELTVDNLKKLRYDSTKLGPEIFSPSSNPPVASLAGGKFLMKKDTSLFPVESQEFTTVFPAYLVSRGIGTKDSNNDLDKEKLVEIEKVTAKKAKDGSKLDALFTDSFWQSDLFYDREFFFATAIRDRKILKR